MKNVLIIAPQNDFHALAVAEKVRQLGGAAHILTRSEFLRNWNVSLGLKPGGIRFEVTTPDFSVCDDELSGVWWRRPNPGPMPCDGPDVEVLEFCRRESDALLYGLLLSLGARVGNPIAAQRAANFKAYQLAVAASVALTIPETLLTNDPAKAVSFRAGRAGRTVFKILTHAPEQKLIETRIFSSEHDELLDSLRLAPAIFQEEIKKDADIRVTFIDGECFSVLCRTSDPECLDWRTDNAVRYEPHQLPAEVGAKLCELHSRLGLRYGAVDLGLTPDGDYVFFETNVAGQFLFGEIEAGLPITAALAWALLNPPSFFAY